MLTKILNAFGRLFLRPSMSAKRSLEPLMNAVLPQAPTNQIIIWNVLEGPFHASEIPDSLVEEGWCLVCQADDNNEFGVSNFWFDDLDSAYIWVRHFKSSIDPIIIDMYEDNQDAN